jgi:hypothetical protein
MWCLITKLTLDGEWYPFFDLAGFTSYKNKLVNGGRYFEDVLREHFLSGSIPLEVTHLYTVELRGLIKRCLSWDMAERFSLEELRTEIDVVNNSPAVAGDEEENVIRIPHTAGGFAPGLQQKGRKRRRSIEDVGGEPGRLMRLL